MNFSLSKMLLPLVVMGAAACASAPPPRAPRRVAKRPAAPQGPTRTDFKIIAKKLMGRCVAGGWINEWRSEHADVDIARPALFLATFEDRTGQDLDQTYLHRTLEQRMRLSGVYDIAADADSADFIASGKLLKLAERTSSSRRISVYTAILDLKNRKTGKIAYTCEATVRGEL